MSVKLHTLFFALMLALAPAAIAQHDAHQPQPTPAQPAPTQAQPAPADAHAHNEAAHDHAAEGGEFNPSEMIMHHVLDTHDWHITDYPTTENGVKVYKPIGIHLPWLFYSTTKGIQFYANTHELLATGAYEVHHEKIHAIEHSEAVYDFSPTKTVVQMLMMLILVTIVFASVAKSYKKREGQAPKGLQSLMEPIITFIRDDVAKPNLGDKWEKFFPYLLSVFFFIWFANVFGLLPFNSNIMGNISVTAALSLLSFIIININGTKYYWQHIFWMPGTPIAVRPMLTIIEFASIFIKPVALMIRLFANISAGHFMVLSLISLIFILGKGGESIGGAAGIAPVSILLTLFIFCLETLVTILQAYIFTLLTATFLGLALEDHHHEGEEAHH